jgi:hypothetical protein
MRANRCAAISLCNRWRGDEKWNGTDQRKRRRME